MVVDICRSRGGCAGLCAHMFTFSMLVLTLELPLKARLARQMEIQCMSAARIRRNGKELWSAAPLKTPRGPSGAHQMRRPTPPTNGEYGLPTRTCLIQTGSSGSPYSLCELFWRIGWKRGTHRLGGSWKAKWDKTPFNKSSSSQIIQRMCRTPQNGQRQLRLGIPLASQFPN